MLKKIFAPKYELPMMSRFCAYSLILPFVFTHGIFSFGAATELLGAPSLTAMFCISGVVDSKCSSFGHFQQRLCKRSIV